MTYKIEDIDWSKMLTHSLAKVITELEDKS